MNLKELFDKAENGTLTYEQFMAAASEGKAKFVDLSDGGYVDRGKYTDELSARDTRISTLSDTITARDADLANLRTQLENAGTDTTKLSEVSTKFADLQKQYDKDTKAYQKQLQEQAYKFAVTSFANEQKFTSQAARRDFISSMMEKRLQMENDTILGASDFRNAYAAENADAFVSEAPTETPKPQPHFVEPTAPKAGTELENGSPFHFDFVGVRPH